MVDGVNAPESLRTAQIAETERRIVDAATRLFLADGYAATSLAAIARAAGVGARTVYVRFGTKANLFKRVVDVAIVGDDAPVDVLGRDWTRAAMAAPTRDERIAAWAAASRQVMERTGALFDAALRASAVEPEIADQFAQGRAQTHSAQHVFWTRMVEDGLLDPGVDVDWLVDTTTVLAGADTYVLTTRMYDWGLDEYQSWLRTTLLRLARSVQPDTVS